ncbi:hypothetical protein ACFO0N_14110 [Halobium salinum]|uniref:Lumazine-binding domain-containing protein n=1 Tax=Halobium salinum TaxID=1364940 RepID=A0ABD5PEK1_9EURY|nr:hypothetical protein [Halobium salinum]
MYTGVVTEHGTVVSNESAGEGRRLTVGTGLETPPDPGDSVAVDGVSLTVSAVDCNRFAVALIPETVDRTTLGDRRAGDRVNLETDVLAKYAPRVRTAN